MQSQRQHPRRSIVSNAVTRGQLRANVTEWRHQAGARPIRQAPQPPIKPLVSPSVQNIVLSLVVIGIAIVTLARKAGVL